MVNGGLGGLWAGKVLRLVVGGLSGLGTWQMVRLMVLLLVGGGACQLAMAGLTLYVDVPRLLVPGRGHPLAVPVLGEPHAFVQGSAVLILLMLVDLLNMYFRRSRGHPTIRRMQTHTLTS